MKRKLNYFQLADHSQICYRRPTPTDNQLLYRYDVICHDVIYHDIICQAIIGHDVICHYIIAIPHVEVSQAIISLENDNSVKEAPAYYCQSFLYGLHK